MNAPHRQTSWTWKPNFSTFVKLICDEKNPLKIDPYINISLSEDDDSTLRIQLSTLKSIIETVEYLQKETKP